MLLHCLEMSFSVQHSHDTLQICGNYCGAHPKMCSCQNNALNMNDRVVYSVQAMTSFVLAIWFFMGAHPKMCSGEIC